jgi:hypothetical protein
VRRVKIRRDELNKLKRYNTKKWKISGMNLEGGELGGKGKIRN